MNVTIIPIASFCKIGYNVAYMMGKDGAYEGFESAGLVDAAGPFRWNPPATQRISTLMLTSWLASTAAATLTWMPTAITMSPALA